MDILPRDVYLYLTNFADDKTVLKMLSVNKKFNDPQFFHDVMSKKYPYLIPFKDKNETWKLFYIRMIYYISKLNEDYDFPYIPSPEFDPEKLYKMIDPIDYRISLSYFKNTPLNLRNKEINNTKLVKYFLNKQISENNTFVFHRYPITIDKKYWNLGLKNAALIGDIDLINRMIIKGANDWNTAMYCAARKGNINLVKVFVFKGADDFDTGLSNAAYSGNKELVDYFLDKGANEIDLALLAAKNGNQNEIIKYLISKGAVDYKS